MVFFIPKAKFLKPLSYLRWIWIWGVEAKSSAFLSHLSIHLLFSLLFDVEIWRNLSPSGLVLPGSLGFLSALSLPTIPAIYLHKAPNQRKVLGKTKSMADVTRGSLMKLQRCLIRGGLPLFPPLTPQALSHLYRFLHCWRWEPIRRSHWKSVNLPSIVGWFFACWLSLSHFPSSFRNK